MTNLSRRGILATGFVVGGNALILGACTANVRPARTDVAIVRVAPPPPRHESPPPLPPERARVEVWQPGHWRWAGNNYDWVPGRYVTRPRSGAHWVPGRWDRRGDGWVYVDGHWT